MRWPGPLAVLIAFAGFSSPPTSPPACQHPHDKIGNRPCLVTSSLLSRAWGCGWSARGRPPCRLGLVSRCRGAAMLMAAAPICRCATSAATFSPCSPASLHRLSDRHQKRAGTCGHADSVLLQALLARRCCFRSPWRGASGSCHPTGLSSSSLALSSQVVVRGYCYAIRSPSHCSWDWTLLSQPAIGVGTLCGRMAKRCLPSIGWGPWRSAQLGPGPIAAAGLAQPCGQAS